MKSTVVEAAREEQIDEIGRALALAFDSDPFFCYVLPDPTERAAKLPILLTSNARFGHLFGMTLTTPGLDGAAVWTPPGVEMTREKAQASGHIRIGETLGREALMRFGGVMERLQPVFETEASEPHWFLNAIGVLPDERRCGLGSALMAQVLSRADEAGLPCYLSSFQPESIAFYESLGFAVRTEALDEESGLRYWTMERAPG